MKVWPIDPLVLRSLKLEVPEKLPQGLTYISPRRCSDGHRLVRRPPNRAGGCGCLVTQPAALAAWAKHLDAGKSRQVSGSRPGQ
jgi:hypothetical protein